MKTWMPKRFSQIVAWFGLLCGVVPVVLLGAVNYFIANHGMHRTSRDIQQTLENMLIKDIRSLTRLRTQGAWHRLEDTAGQIERLGLWARKALEEPETFLAINQSPILPNPDPTTGQLLTPESAGYSLRIPKGVLLTPELTRQALALESLTFAIKDLYEKEKEPCLDFFIITPSGIDFSYPWTDFPAAIRKGLLKPETRTFQGIAFIQEALRSHEPFFITPLYNDFWGRGWIFSILVPIRGLKGEILGVVGTDIRPDSLLEETQTLALGTLAPRFFLVNLKPATILDIEGFADAKERRIVQELLHRGLPAREGVSLISGHYLLREPVPGLHAELLSVFGKDEAIRLLSPIQKTFGHQRKVMGRIFGFAFFLVFGAVGLAGVWVARWAKRLSSHFEGQLKRIQEGDFHTKIAYQGIEELETFAKTLNTTLETINHEREALDKRNNELTLALETIEGQKETILGLSIPIIPILSRTLLVPLIGALDSYRARQLEELLLEQVSKTKTRNVLLEMTGCPFMDTYTAKGLRDVTTALRILGARVFLVGLRPEVVRQMVGLGVEFGDVEAALSLEAALMRLMGMKA